jgi:hypothetical protein
MNLFHRQRKGTDADGPIYFSGCSNNAGFNASIIYSSVNVAVVGDMIVAGLSKSSVCSAILTREDVQQRFLQLGATLDEKIRT